jgi:hypothetical protein
MILNLKTDVLHSHEAYHYCYNLFKNIDDTLDRLCAKDDNAPDRDGDADRLFEYLEKGGHIKPVSSVI